MDENTFANALLHKKNRLWFSEMHCAERIDLPKHFPDIRHVVSTFSIIEILSIKTIKTICSQSFEGQCLTGKAAGIEMLVKGKTLYQSSQDSKTLHIVESIFYQSASVTIPCKIEGTDTEVLLARGRLRCETLINCDTARVMNSRCITKNLSLSLYIKLLSAADRCYDSYIL